MHAEARQTTTQTPPRHPETAVPPCAITRHTVSSKFRPNSLKTNKSGTRQPSQFCGRHRERQSPDWRFFAACLSLPKSPLLHLLLETANRVETAVTPSKQTIGAQSTRNRKGGPSDWRTAQAECRAERRGVTSKPLRLDGAEGDDGVEAAEGEGIRERGANAERARLIRDVVEVALRIGYGKIGGGR